MSGETSRFKDECRSRRLTLTTPDGHEVPDGVIDHIAEAFVQEREQQPELIKGVVIYAKQGRLALDIYAHGTESVLQQKAGYWGSILYPHESTPPLGHEWSIDSPENVRDIVIQ